MAAVGQGLLSSVGRIAGRPARQYRWNTLVGQADEAIVKRRLGEAADYLEQALVLARAEWPEGMRLGESLLRLADLSAALERDDEALRLYVQGISTLVALPDGIDGRLAHAVSNLGRMLLLRGDQRKADALTRAATALQRKFGEAATPILLLNRALVSAEAGQDDDAQLAFNDAIAALDRASGPRDLQAVAVYDNYALFCASRGRRDDAEVLLRRCLILRQEAAGPRHPIYATGLINLARLRIDEVTAGHRSEGVRGPEEVEALLWQSADICERAGLHPASGLLPTLYYMARVALGTGRADETAALCDRILDFGQRERYAQRAAEAAALHILARLQKGGSARTAGVEPQLRRALDISRNLKGTYRALGHELTVGLLADLADFLAAAGKTGEAEHLAHRSETMRRAPVWALARQVFPSV